MTADRIQFRMAGENAPHSPKVLIFTAPILCSGCKNKGPDFTHKDSKICWSKTTLKLREESFVPCKQQTFSIKDDDLTEESDIRLEYEPLAIQESVCLYLESEFKNTEHTLQPTESYSFGFEPGCCTAGGNVDNGILQREFEDIRCASQRLLVENGAQSSSISSDEIKKGIKRKFDSLCNFDCDSDTHQLTMEDVYTQNKFPSVSSSDTCSPIHKEATTTEITPVMSPDVAPSTDHAHELGNPSFHFAVPKVCNTLTALKNCNSVSSLVNILFVVIQVNDIRDVQIKSGTSAGTFVAVSSFLVADESKPCFKVTLWREASRWTEKIMPGDFAVATSIKVGKWRDEFVGQTTFKSGFYNLHQPRRLLSNICLNLVSQERFDALVRWVRKEHLYLFGSSYVKRKVEVTEIAQLLDNTLVHFRAKLISIYDTSPSSSTYHFGSQQLTKITAVLEERPGEKIQLFLWGRQAAWMNQLKEGLGRVWEFQYLTAKYNTDAGCVSLHSTSRSTKTKLPIDDVNASSIMLRFDEAAKPTRKFANLHDLLESKYTGLAKLEAEITSLQFHCGEVIIVDKTTSSTDQLKEKIDKLVFIGCGSCSRALVQDTNGVYCQCSHCVVTNPNYQYTISYYYKPLTLFLGDFHASLQVEAFGCVISRLFHDFPAKTLIQTAANGPSRDNGFVDSFVTFVGALVKGVKCKVKVASHVTLDENSFIETRSFTLQKIDLIR